jgi:hypothetical protein
MRCLIALSLFLASHGAAMAVPAEDPLQSAECREALAALRLQEDRAATASAPDQAPRPGRALERARHGAARACLRSRADPPPAGRFAQPPVSLPPAVEPPPLRPPVTAVVPRSPEVPVPPPATPTVVTSCDAGGCWTSDGSRVNRVGSVLVGPRGACSPMGATMVCP